MKASRYAILTMAFSTFYSLTTLANDWYKSYEVLFTNPECPERNIVGHFEGRSFISADKVPTQDGEGFRSTTKKNAYCFANDARASALRENSPQRRILEWVNDPKAQEITLSAFTFSHKGLFYALCARAKKGVRVDLVVHGKPELAAKMEKECQGESGQKTVFIHPRGSHKSLAHIKMVMVNPGREDFRLAFSSANLSSGIVLHHETWNFIHLNPQGRTAGEHQCLRETLFNEEACKTKAQFSKALEDCRKTLTASPDHGLTSFFTPAYQEGGKAFAAIREAIRKSEKVWLAVHHFSHTGLTRELQLFADQEGGAPDRLRMIADDDLFWVKWAKDRNEKYTGHNTLLEYERTMSFLKEDQIRFMETNGQENRFHHNKFIIFQFKGGGGAVFAGAGNFTNSGFKDNFENFYYIEIPHVVEAYIKQYHYLWEKLASKKGDLPSTYRLKVNNPGRHSGETGDDPSGEIPHE